MIGLLDNSIRKHLSSILGAAVTFEKLSISLLGSIDAQGVAVAGVGSEGKESHGDEPFLTIRRLHADIAIGRALKGEIVFKSLSIEWPVISIVRRMDGTTNLPRMLRADGPDEGGDAAGGSGGAGAGGNGGEGHGGGGPRWRVDTPKVFVVDGEAHFRQQMAGGDYRVLATGIVVELTHTAPGFDFTVTANSVAANPGDRRDKPVETGAVRMSGRLEGIDDLSDIERAGVTVEADFGSGIGGIRLTGQCPALSEKRGSGSVEGAIDVGMAMELMPGQVELPAVLRGLSGVVRAKASGSYSPERGAEATEVSISTARISAKESR